MDAHAVWALWRRILREPELQEWMFGSRSSPEPDPQLSAEEKAIVDQYASNELSTRFFIENYRFRMASSVVNALGTTAPLTRHVLELNGIELNAVAKDLLESTGWRDYGPYVYTLGKHILGRIATRPDVARIPGISELIRLEQTAADVIMAAASGRPTHQGRPPPPSPWRASPWLRLVRCNPDVSPWLRDRAALGVTAPALGSRHFAVYLASLDSKPRIAALPHAAAAILAGLTETATLGAQALDGVGSHDDDVLVHRLCRMGLISRVPAGPR